MSFPAGCGARANKVKRACSLRSVCVRLCVISCMPPPSALSRRANEESGEDSDDDQPVPVPGRGTQLSASSSHTPNAPSPSTRLPRGVEAKQAVRPSISGCGQCELPWHDNPDFALLVQHVVGQTEIIMRLQAQQSHLFDIVRNQSRELAKALNCPSIANGMPPPYNPFDDEFTVPGPKDEDQRDMTPLERCVLSREVRNKMLVLRIRERISRIVAPTDWWKPSSKPITFDVDSYDTAKLWKLWHVVRYNLGINSVLTSEEIAASKEPKKATPSLSIGATAPHTAGQQTQPAATPARAAGAISPSLLLACDDASAASGASGASAAVIDTASVKAQQATNVSHLVAAKRATDEYSKAKKRRKKDDSDFHDSSDDDDRISEARLFGEEG